MKYRTFAFFSIFFLIVISSVLKPHQGFSFLTPCFSIVAIIYWIVNKANPMNGYHFFLLGLLNDLFLGTPLGSSSIFYFIIKISINLIESRFKNNSMTNYLGKFVFGITVYYFSIYMFIIIYFENYPSISYFLMSYLLTLFIFPLIYIILNWIEGKHLKDQI